MINCNPCENQKCGSCVAEGLAVKGIIRDAGFHCGCAERGHKNEEVVLERPGVKSMFSPVKDNDPHIPEQEIVEEE